MDHSECIFSLDIDIDPSPLILLAPDGLTVIINSPTSYYSWNCDTDQFDCIHFADEVRLGPSTAYAPDGKLCACRSSKDNNVRVWDAQTGQLCGKPITMSYYYCGTIRIYDIVDLATMHRNVTGGYAPV